MKDLSSPHAVTSTNYIYLCGAQLSFSIESKLSQIYIFLLSFFFALPIQAANPLDLVINEIAWMGTEASYNNEWIELYNNADSPINVSGWKLAAQDGIPEINLTGIIPANSFYLLERTDDNTLPEISADQIYSGALNNNGEKLELYDNYGNLIDSIDCSSGWLAGSNLTKQTMERKTDGNWQTSQSPGGTPKKENGYIGSQPEEKVEETQAASSTIPEIKNYPSGIVINEILPSPVGPDEEEEWIEIFNQNQEKVELFNWKIADNVGGIKTYTFPQGTNIPPQGFLVLSRQITKITLNNDGDGLSLIQPDGNVVETINFPQAPRGQSYNRTFANAGDPVWSWSTILTPGAKNEIPAQVSENKKEINSVEEVKNPVLEEAPEKEGGSLKNMAAVSEQISTKSPNFFLVLLIAFLVAVFSGVIIFFIKRVLKNLI